MSARIVDVENGLVTVRITGRLRHEELKDLQDAAAEVIGNSGPIRVLAFVEDFMGWAKEGDWGDMAFQVQFDAEIQRMAIVAEEKWEELILVFAAKGLRPFPVEFFLPKDVRKARQWLAEAEVTG